MATKKPIMALPTTRGEHALMHVRGQQKHVDSGVKKIITTKKLPQYKYTDTPRHLHSSFNRNTARFKRERQKECVCLEREVEKFSAINASQRESVIDSVVHGFYN